MPALMEIYLFLAILGGLLSERRLRASRQTRLNSAELELFRSFYGVARTSESEPLPMTMILGNRQELLVGGGAESLASEERQCE